MKILILRLSSIGDIVLTQPVTRVLRENYKTAEIDYLTRPAYKGVVEAFGCVDNIYEWRDKKNALKIIRQKKYDLVIDLHAKLNTGIIKFLSGTRKIITVNKKHFYRWALTKKIISKPNDPMSDIYQNTLKKIGITVQNYLPELHPNSVLKNEITKLLQNQGIDHTKRLIGIFPGALHYTKRYPATEFARFIDKVPDSYNCSFLILGSTDDYEIAEKIIARTGVKTYNLCGKVTIPELIVLIDILNLVISNDSGPMHIAAALKKKQIAIFGGTHSMLGFAPLNFNALLLQANLPCQPCSTYGLEKCPLGSLECMNSITPDNLLEAFEDLMN
jgi:heptosyltransferase II